MKKAIALCLLSIFLTAVYTQSSQGMEPTREKEIVALLSEVKYSDDLIDTVHENGKVLKAISLYLRMIDRRDMSEDEKTMRLAHLFTKAGWTEWVPVMKIKRLKSTLYLVGIGYAFGTQPSSLYVFYDSSYKKIATGENGLINVIDYRMVGDELGVIFNRVPGSTAFEPDFALLRKEKGKWNVQWTPEGQREWIAMDGEIKFLKADLSLIQVRGTSFALQSAIQASKEEVFCEGHASAHRFFIGIWEKQGEAYLRKTKLPPNVPFYDKLCEMTEPSPYATVFEFLRRLRIGEDGGAAELSGEMIVKKAKELGLSEIVDSKGNIICYDWGFNRSGKAEPDEEEIKHLKSVPEGVFAEFFYRADTDAQYMALLKPIDQTQLHRTQWRVIGIDKIYKVGAVIRRAGRPRNDGKGNN